MEEHPYLLACLPYSQSSLSIERYEFSLMIGMCCVYNGTRPRSLLLCVRMWEPLYSYSFAAIHRRAQLLLLDHLSSPWEKKKKKTLDFIFSCYRFWRIDEQRVQLYKRSSIASSFPYTSQSIIFQLYLAQIIIKKKSAFNKGIDKGGVVVVVVVQWESKLLRLSHSLSMCVYVCIATNIAHRIW